MPCGFLFGECDDLYAASRCDLALLLAILGLGIIGHANKARFISSHILTVGGECFDHTPEAKRAMAIDFETVQKQTMNDPDLQPLWESMNGTMWEKE